jgi:hypothetical protein
MFRSWLEHPAMPSNVVVRAPSTHPAHLVRTTVMIVHSQLEATARSSLNLSGFRVLSRLKRLTGRGCAPE